MKHNKLEQFEVKEIELERLSPHPDVAIDIIVKLLIQEHLKRNPKSAFAKLFPEWVQDTVTTPKKQDT